MDKQEFGDWQTPLELVHSVLAVVAEHVQTPAAVLEPTCGEGSFLVAARDRYPDARLLGYEINESYARAARARLSGTRARIKVADFFAVDWAREVARIEQPILVTGNPPWVTNAVLGTLRSTNVPEKSNFKKMKGFDALTGKSNFDVSEWMLLRLIEALQGRHATLAVLCKAAVARRVVEASRAMGFDLSPGGCWRIDAMRHFRAAVDAVLFVCTTKAEPGSVLWPVYDTLEARVPATTTALVDGVTVVDAERHEMTAHLLGDSDPEWRSGMKHDCARIMELSPGAGGWINGLGETVAIEEDLIFPLLKSSDVARGVSRPSRAVVVPQRSLGEDTAALCHRAPKAWQYLAAHRGLFKARKSSIYRDQPDFSVFGVGAYAFAPWKVAISGLYKRCKFTLIGPHRGRPVMVDDTCYFLPFDEDAAARRAHRALTTPLARDFFAARIFWDAKRPITKSVLQKLDLRALLEAVRKLQ